MLREEKWALMVSVVLATGLTADDSRPASVHESTMPRVETVASRAVEVTAERVIDAFEHNFGVHAGRRRNHVKGLCVLGEFTGEVGVQAWSRSMLFSGEPIPVVARFSLPGGNPAVSDASVSPRGMALEFRLRDGVLQHMTMLNVPVFGAATPQSFYEGLLASVPDPATGKANPERLRLYRQSHSDTVPLSEFMKGYRPPASYATTTYFGIHAFRFVNIQGDVAPVRWRFEPEDGNRTLDDAQLIDSPVDFLSAVLADRLAEGPVRWRMVLVLAEPGDPLDDPTRAWPAARRNVVAGTLLLTTAADQSACAGINFDPMVMADGIEPSDDPVLAFRSSAYAVSFARRLLEAHDGSGDGL